MNWNYENTGQVKGMKYFCRCTVCNDIRYGIAPPEICPTGQAERAYVEIDKSEAKFVLDI